MFKQHFFLFYYYIMSITIENEICPCQLNAVKLPKRVKPIFKEELRTGVYINLNKIPTKIIKIMTPKGIRIIQGILLN